MSSTPGGTGIGGITNWSTTTDIPGFTLTFNAIATRNYLLAAEMPFAASVANTVFVNLTTGANVLVASAGAAPSMASGDIKPHSLRRVVTGLTGSNTYKLRAAASSTNSVGACGASGSVATLLIEDIGPSGNAPVS
jgi:hypothetical protein